MKTDNRIAGEATESLQLRAPSEVMRLERLGSYYPTRLSFLRVMLRRAHKESWQFTRKLWQMDSRGVGTASYAINTGHNVYTLVAFAHELPDHLRSDRVIAEAWDATFTLVDGTPTAADIARLEQHVPLQEGARLSDGEFVLSRANKSVRLFDHTVERLSQGLQPDKDALLDVGYLMRTTAVYGSGKFGAADRKAWAERDEFSGSFQPEMLAVWLIRQFTVDLVEHVAAERSPDTAVTLSSDRKRMLGVGNSTGLGMAPFLLNHPALLHHWIHARETALARIRHSEKLGRDNGKQWQQLQTLLSKALTTIASAPDSDPLHAKKLASLSSGLAWLQHYVEEAHSEVIGKRAMSLSMDQLFQSTQTETDSATTEYLVSILLELYPQHVDDLPSKMSVDETLDFRINGRMTRKELLSLLKTHYAWTLNESFSSEDSIARVWYVSAEKLEPRLGERFEESIEPYELALAPARAVRQLYELLDELETDNTATAASQQTVGEFLMQHPQHRHTVRRVQTVAKYPYAEIRDNTIAASMRPLDMLQCKLSFFGAARFDPRSDRWLRVTLYQYLPYPDEITLSDPDDAFNCPVADSDLSNSGGGNRSGNLTAKETINHQGN